MYYMSSLLNISLWVNLNELFINYYDIMVKVVNQESWLKYLRWGGVDEFELKLIEW